MEPAAYLQYLPKLTWGYMQAVLKERLSNMELSTTGNKKTLVARLQEALSEADLALPPANTKTLSSMG